VVFSFQSQYAERSVTEESSKWLFCIDVNL